MDERELAAQLSLLLGEELTDRIIDLDRVVLALERSPGDEALQQELRRVLHVVKGASRSAGVVAIETACHELETVLGAVEPGAPVPPPILAAATQLVVQLGHARTQLLAGAPVELSTPSAPPGVASEQDPSMRVAADDLDLMMTHSAAVLVARQGLSDPIHLLNELQRDLGVRRSISPTQLAGLARELAAIYRSIAKADRELDVASRQLDERVRQIRLRSIGDAAQGCERIVHDTATTTGKLVDFAIQGTGVRVDRAQIEVLRDVLIQLVRNSVAHGIELPEDRQRAGKPERGRIVIDADLAGDAVRIIVSDDGAGLDLDAIRARAATYGIRVDTIADAAAAIFAPGLSTAATITELAGRGVGLDVAKQRIEAMHGSIAVASVPHKGTTFTIELPITVATLSAFVLTAAEVVYAVPAASVERVVRVAPDALRHADGRSLLRIGESWVPIGTLAHVLGRVPRPADRGSAIVVAQAGRRVALFVDHIAGLVELAVGALDSRLGRIRHVTGQARLANGTIALVVKPSDLIEDVLGLAVAAPNAEPAPAAVRRRILVVDDSATTRALEANILRTAGYEVTVAVDGAAALRALSEHLVVDLVVSDVDMPNLTGFELAQAIRNTERLAGLPIILVTARGTEDDRARGLRAGASAYLVKSSFDQTLLLQTIARLL